MAAAATQRSRLRRRRHRELERKAGRSLVVASGELRELEDVLGDRRALDDFVDRLQAIGDLGGGIDADDDADAAPVAEAHAHDRAAAHVEPVGNPVIEGVRDGDRKRDSGNCHGVLGPDPTRLQAIAVAAGIPPADGIGETDGAERAHAPNVAAVRAAPGAKLRPDLSIITQPLDS